MPIDIKEKRMCTGCEACASVCPQSCIEMCSDEDGFLYPYIIREKCIECDLCIKVCPIMNRNDELSHNHQVEVYAGWTKDKNVRFESTSGGLFSELSTKVLENGGYVVGAAYNDDCEVEHLLISNVSELGRIRQSKYTQSRIGDIYVKIKELLEKKKVVLFCGAPCQVAGLKNALRKEYDNLVTVDFICRGMNSPKAYKYWLKELEEKYHSKAQRVWFKYKINGWKNSPFCTRIDFVNGKYCVLNGYKNTYMRGYLGPNLYIRPSCGECLFKGVNRVSDITLADFWGISKELDDDKGTSLIMLNTLKGKHLFEKSCKNLYVEKRKLEEILGANVCFEQSVVINSQSSEFLKELDKEPFSKLINKYAKVSFWDLLIEEIKVKIRSILLLNEK